MITLIRVAVLLIVMVPVWSPTLLLAQAPAPQQQDEFVPIDELPPQDQLPAAPLLVGAYAFVLVVLFVYVVSVSRRLVGVERDMARLQSEVARSAKG
jgi:hypothetical protein